MRSRGWRAQSRPGPGSFDCAWVGQEVGKTDRLVRPSLMKDRTPSGMSEAFRRLAQVLAPQYRIDHLIGVGATSHVYLAEDVVHQRRVAVKVLRAALAGSIVARRF